MVNVASDRPFDFEPIFRRALFGPVAPEGPVLETRGALRAVGERCASSLSAHKPDAQIDQALVDLREVIAESDEVHDGIRVAMMGRTMSGKSTLFEFLTGGDGSLMGSGGQRTTRTPLERPSLLIPGCTLVDTPGVGARDGQRDREIAFEAARDCDLVLWVFANDSTQAETANALEELAELGKPLLLFLNCRERIDSEIRRKRLVADPERAYRDAEGHWLRVFEVLASMGTAPLHRLAGHALAAQVGSSGGDQSLVTASNAEVLLEALRYETSPLRARQWQLLREARRLRKSMSDWSSVLMMEASKDASEAQTLNQQADEVDARLDRTLEELSVAGINELKSRVDSSRSWYLSADLSGDVANEWEDETGHLNADVRALFQRLDKELIRAIEDEVEAFLDDWSMPNAGPSTGVRNENVSGKANRLAKLVARAGPGVTATVTLALISNPVGWTGAGVVAAALVSNAILKKFALGDGGLIDRWMPGRKKKAELARSRLGSQTREELADFEAGATSAWKTRIEQSRQECRRRSNEMRQGATGRKMRAESREMASTELGLGMREIDRELVRGLLQAVGHGEQARLADHVLRVPGVGSAVALEEPLRSEMQLFPGDDLCEPMVPTRLLHSGEPWQASAEVVFGAARPPFRVISSREPAFSVGAAAPTWTLDGVKRLAIAVCGSQVQISVEGAR